MQITPPMYASGLYVAGSPFTLNETAIYTTQAIRSFEDCQQRNINVYTEIYAPLNIPRAKYLSDKDKGVNIITLTSHTEPTVYIPDSYISAYPNMNLATANRYVVSIDLGILSSDWFSDGVLAQFKNLASDIVGGEPTGSLHKIPVIGRAASLSPQEIEGLRSVAIATRTSDYALLQESRRHITTLNKTIEALQARLIELSE